MFTATTDIVPFMQDTELRTEKFSPISFILFLIYFIPTRVMTLHSIASTTLPLAQFDNMLARVWGLALLFSVLLAVVRLYSTHLLNFSKDFLQPIKMPNNPVEGLPFVVLYQPVKSAVAPIRLGERSIFTNRCDSIFQPVFRM